MITPVVAVDRKTPARVVDQRVAQRIARIRIVARHRADHRADGRVLRNRAAGQRRIRRRRPWIDVAPLVHSVEQEMGKRVAAAGRHVRVSREIQVGIEEAGEAPFVPTKQVVVLERIDRVREDVVVGRDIPAGREERVRIAPLAPAVRIIVTGRVPAVLPDVMIGRKVEQAVDQRVAAAPHHAIGERIVPEAVDNIAAAARAIDDDVIVRPGDRRIDQPEGNDERLIAALGGDLAR